MSTPLDRVFAGTGGVAAKLLRKFGVPFTLLQLAAPNSVAFGGNADLVSLAIEADAGLSAYVWEGGDFTAAGITVGSWINVQGFPVAGANGLAKVAGVTSEVLTVEKTLPDAPAGERVGISKLTAASAYGVLGEWTQQYLADGVIKATDLRITLDASALVTFPEDEGWMIGQGSTPTAASLHPILRVLKTYSGESVAVLEVAARA